MFSIQLQYENERPHTAKHCGATAPNPLLSSALWCWAVWCGLWRSDLALQLWIVFLATSAPPSARNAHDLDQYNPSSGPLGGRVT